MRTTVPGVLLASLALISATGAAQAGETYVALGLGLATDEIGASTTGINHPTRCDSVLYADPANAASDAACTDNTARRFFGDSFDLGGALAGSIGLGYAWSRFRVEAEFLGASHDGETRPGLADAANPALQGKSSEWSADSPPFYRVSNFRTRQLFINLYYSFGEGAVWTPYVGVGAGIARINTDYTGYYLRSTVADGYVEAVGGNPMRPEDWQLAAAGSESRLDAEIRDQAFGYRVLAGLERRLGDSTYGFLTLRWSDFGGISTTDTWTIIRSHAPVQSDGVTPFTTEQALDDIGGLAATVGIRYGF